MVDCKDLVYLNLSNNNIKELKDIEVLSKLEKLLYLNLCGNPIMEIGLEAIKSVLPTPILNYETSDSDSSDDSETSDSDSSDYSEPGDSDSSDDSEPPPKMERPKGKCGVPRDYLI